MDYASYHTIDVNKAPTMSCTKDQMQNWIISKGLTYLPTMVKAQLYEMVRPYHCDLNPIELIWSVLKRRVAEKNVGQEVLNVVKITEEAFSSIYAEEWKKECDHVKKLEDKYHHDGISVDCEIDNFIIELGDDDSVTSDDTDESHDSDGGSLLGFICVVCSRVGTASKGAYFSWVSMIAFWFTGILLGFYLFHIVEKFYKIPWLRLEFLFAAVWSLLYLIASILATTVGDNAHYAASFFGFAATLAYMIDAYLKFRLVRAGGLAQGSRVVSKQTTEVITPPGGRY